MLFLPLLLLFAADDQPKDTGAQLAAELGAATHVLPLSEIAPALASVTHPQVRLASKTG